jgi:hypothetical protein
VAHVLVLADDRCIQVTCAEVLGCLGFRVSVGAYPPRACESRPDVILVWEAGAADISAVRAAYRDVPLLVCTYDHRQQWNGTVGVVQLPFSRERVALALGRALRPARETAA